MQSEENSTRGKRSGVDMTEGIEWRKILIFAIPIIIGTLLQQLYNTVDGIVVGRYVNSDALAAVGNCTTLARFFLAFSQGFSNGCGVIISQFYGARQKNNMKKAAGTGILIALGLGVFFSAFGLIFHNWILTSALKIEEASVAHYANQYFTVYCIGLIFTYAYNFIAYTLRAMGDSRATLYFLALTSILNLILDLFMVPLFGIAGAATATVISQCVCAVVSYIYMIKRYPELNFVKAKTLRLDKEMALKCINLGIPAILQQCSVSLGNLTMQRLVNSYGSVTMAAYTVGSKVEGYLHAPAQGIQQSMSVFTGQNVGASNYDRVKKGLYQALMINVAVTLVLGIGFNIAATPVVALFGVEGEVLKEAVEFVKFTAPFNMMIFSIYFTCAGLIQGSGDVGYATFVSLSALAMRVLFSYVMKYGFGADYHILWRSALVSNGLSLVLAWARYFAGTWKKKSKKIVGEKES